MPVAAIETEAIFGPLKSEKMMPGKEIAFTPTGKTRVEKIGRKGKMGLVCKELRL
jgi:hypothetical protein